MRYWRYTSPFGGGPLRIWKWIKAWILLLVLRSLKCESHNHRKSHGDEDWDFREVLNGTDNKWACARCFRIVCWNCEGTHEDDQELDAVCDNCWVEITNLREEEEAA